ncbi:hypothetical protein TOPH_04679 [Tolypocladium ophioglossoides CBS 100239]|uniref:Uncharacterized protein n=1 Tax=Tolypocladium ophioglossoides (strain CBS 100239) TaxID=1163406 RepID=A0A0L0N975_TOLOC|nr:hypothetical protein TOPH_04679 [Tolypocladium ophioglossoides CBS 100239]
MPPPNGSSKSRKAGPSKQPLKPVVPALPLPYVKRQAAAAAAASTRLPPPKPTTDNHDTNGIAQEKAKEAVDQSPVSGTKHEAESQLGDGKQSTDSSSTDGQTNPHGPTPPATCKFDPVEEAAVVDASDVSADLQVVENPIQRPSPDRPSEISVALDSTATKTKPQQKPIEQHSAKMTKSRPPPGISPTRYQMPPPFQPANRPLGMMGNGDVPRGPRPHPQNGPHHIHQAHPSNGSIHFGTFHGSQSSSPAPPHSGGIAPPPGMTGPDGRSAYMGHAGNGFPPMMPYGTDMMHATNFDNYGRPVLGYGPMESYPPYGNNFGPSTPHSFHDSQSSAHPEDNGMYGQYPPGALRNGGAVPGDDVHAQNPQGRMFGPPEYPRPMMPNPGPPPMIPHGDHGDGVVGYLQQQFASPELADCTLELRYSDDRARPVRIPGHRLIFARSPELSALLQKQALPPGVPDRALQPLLLESDSKWVRSDSFYMAVQRLYGLPLLHVPPHNRADSGDVTEAGSAKEQFEFALSYAAAGRLLDWGPVVRRGCEVATLLLGWQTLEKGLEFAMDGYSDNGSHESYKYGDGSRAILNAVATYVVHNLPPSFNLDITVEVRELYARLPAHPPAPPTPTPAVSKTVTSPAIARGSSVQLGKGRRSQQIANIQFGDLSLSEGKNASESETPKATRQAQPVSHATLSRVLLNLPFAQLKMILESSGSGNVNGWANTETRYRVIKRAVEERELRRLRALEAVVGGRVPGSEEIRTALRSPNPRDMGQWSALGWQEEILPQGNPDGPSLSRTWIPLMEPQNGSAAEYP